MLPRTESQESSSWAQKQRLMVSNGSEVEGRNLEISLQSHTAYPDSSSQLPRSKDKTGVSELPGLY